MISQKDSNRVKFHQNQALEIIGDQLNQIIDLYKQGSPTISISESPNEKLFTDSVN